jgi:type I restriction enzyme M protein
MPKLSLAKLERHLYGAADILRQEGMDAATYKDFIFGMLFLKRCSDTYEAERACIVDRKVSQGMPLSDAQVAYGENPDFYDEFFVPEHARWSYLKDKLNDASEAFGAVLDKALCALSDANEPLQHVLDHIQFMRVQSNKRVVSDDACRALVRHFSKYRLRNEDFQFSDLLGSAYEFLINMFAESAGKKGGDFYTPRDVIRVMVRILNPTPGMRIYDPTCGSGGMLIISREYIEQSGGDTTNLRLCGQVNDASAWSICKINMLLHGIRGADIRLQDTLLHPLHREAGELERFDRVIANPPFSQNYTRSNMEFQERFRWGWCPTSGKKGDLMFAQHMLAVCRPDGMVATVMPHGVLFRGGAEKEIRKKFLQEDLIEAIIGLPQNLFYGAGIPACILIMRANLTGQTPNPNKPENRRGRILFINADAEFLAGRAQNYLRPEHMEKIAATFERYETVPHYSRSVPLEEIVSQANDHNLNIRRYVDNAPPPEPHDVRAHLVGGIPTSEISNCRSLFESLGFKPQTIFTPRPEDDRYHDFCESVSHRPAIASLIESDPHVDARIAALHDALTHWWTTHSESLVALPQVRNLNAVRGRFLREFVRALLSLGVLDRFKLAGVVAAWWADTLPDLKTLMENDFCAVVDGWIDAIADAVEDGDSVGPTFDPFSHKLVKQTMDDYLQQIDDAKAAIAASKAEKEAFEQSNPPDDADDEALASWNYAKALQNQIKVLKAVIKETLMPVKDLKKGLKGREKQVKSAEKRIQQLTGSGPKSILRAEKNGQPVEPLRDDLYKQQEWLTVAQAKAANFERKIVGIETSVLPYELEIERINKALSPYEEIKTALAAARATFRVLTNAFVDELKNRCAEFSMEEKQTLVLELFVQDLQGGLDAAVMDRRQSLVGFIEKLWGKYRVSLNDIKQDRHACDERLSRVLKEFVSI